MNLITASTFTGLIICCSLGIYVAYNPNSPYYWNQTWDSNDTGIEILLELVGKIFSAILDFGKKIFLPIVFIIEKISELLVNPLFAKLLVLIFGFIMLQIYISNPFDFSENLEQGLENIKELIPIFLSLVAAILKAWLAAFVYGYMAITSARFWKIIS